MRSREEGRSQQAQGIGGAWPDRTLDAGARSTCPVVDNADGATRPKSHLRVASSLNAREAIHYGSRVLNDPHEAFVETELTRHFEAKPDKIWIDQAPGHRVSCSWFSAEGGPAVGDARHDRQQPRAHGAGRARATGTDTARTELVAYVDDAEGPTDDLAALLRWVGRFPFDERCRWGGSASPRTGPGSPWRPASHRRRAEERAPALPPLRLPGPSCDGGRPPFRTRLR